MAKKEKYEVIKTVRLTRTQSDKLIDLNFNIRDAIEFYINHFENPHLQKLEKKRQIEKQIQDKENEIKLLKTELETINKELNIPDYLNEEISLDLSMDCERIIDAFKKDATYSKKGIDSFIGTDKYNRIFDNCVNRNGGLDKDAYAQKLEKCVRKKAGKN